MYCFKNTISLRMYTLNCKGKLLVIDKPLVMGVINATPDSFYEGHLDKGMAGIAAQRGPPGLGICEAPSH